MRIGPPIPDLDHILNLEPGVPVSDWRLNVPAHPACYVLEDAQGRPVLLATVRDLRAALTRRLQASHDASAGVDLTGVVRRVRYRAVCGRLEADWLYLEHARVLFPNRYRTWIRRWRSHWIGADVSAPIPLMQVHTQPQAFPEACFGPVIDGRTARKALQAIEDLFDLCREHEILKQTPHGTACDYKAMGRCPAPCDGSVPMDQYRQRVIEAIGFLCGDQALWRERLEQDMRDAAVDRAFERAGRLKQKLDQAKTLAAGPFSAWRSLDQFEFLCLETGPRRTRRLLWIRGGFITPMADWRGAMDPSVTEALWQAVMRWRCRPKAGMEDVERLGLIARHLADRPEAFWPMEDWDSPEKLNAKLSAAESAPEETASVSELESMEDQPAG